MKMRPAAWLFSKALLFPLFLCDGLLADNCPGSPSFIHASCKMSVTFAQNSCLDIMEEVSLRVNGTDGWCDPHNKGTYKIVNYTSNEYSLTRLTGNKKYMDKMNLMFTPMATASTGCVVSACSESQVTSVVDLSTNYCNLHDLMCGSADGCNYVKHDLSSMEKLESCTQHDASQCLKTCGPKT